MLIPVSNFLYTLNPHLVPKLPPMKELTFGWQSRSLIRRNADVALAVDLTIEQIGMRSHTIEHFLLHTLGNDQDVSSTIFDQKRFRTETKAKASYLFGIKKL